MTEYITVKALFTYNPAATGAWSILGTSNTFVAEDNLRDMDDAEIRSDGETEHHMIEFRVALPEKSDKTTIPTIYLK